MMRIVWGLHDLENESYLIALFEAENLLVGYREQLLREWFDQVTAPIPEREYFPGEEFLRAVDDEARALREEWLDLGYERWRNDEVNRDFPRYFVRRYELWNSVPPNPERLVMHFDT